MLIILEGVDYTGKSTLARELSKELDIPVFDSSFNRIKELDNDASLQEFASLSMGIFHSISTLQKQVDFDIITDRSYLTEYIYSKLNINGERERREGLFDAWKEALPEDTLLIYLTADKSTIIKRREKDNDGDIEVEDIEKIKSLYEEFIECEDDLNKITLDTSDVNSILPEQIFIDKRVELIKNYINLNF